MIYGNNDELDEVELFRRSITEKLNDIKWMNRCKKPEHMRLTTEDKAILALLDIFDAREDNKRVAKNFRMERRRLESDVEHYKKLYEAEKEANTSLSSKIKEATERSGLFIDMVRRKFGW